MIDLYTIADRNLRWYTELLPPSKPPEWTTPNTIVGVQPSVLLRDFGGNGPPLLILPPQAGHHSCIADFAEGQSLVQTCLKAGYHVFACEWLSCTYERRNEGIADHIEDIRQCVDFISLPVTLIGLCQGGWAAAVYAALYPDSVEHLICVASPLDFNAGNGFIKLWSQALPMSYFEWLVVVNKGMMPGKLILQGFKAMRYLDHYFTEPLDLYVNLDDPAFVQRYRHFHDWYDYTLTLPGTFYLQAVKWLFRENKLIHGGLCIDGRYVHLQHITCPVTLIAGVKDDITPKDQVFNAAQYFGTNRIVRCLVNAGHIGCFTSRKVLEECWPVELARFQSTKLTEPSIL